MDIAALQEEIDQVSIAFYQNREEEGLEQVGLLLPKLKTVTDALSETGDGGDPQILYYIARMYQNFNEAYKQRDMLGMADCLQEYAASVVELYRIKYQGQEDGKLEKECESACRQ